MNPKPVVFRSTLVGAVLVSGMSAVWANPGLAKKNNCLACHATASQLVGPAYQAVAAKYAGQTDAVATLVKNIRAGGAGRWGDMAMPPQPQLSEADAKKLATWILGGAK